MKVSVLLVHKMFSQFGVSFVMICWKMLLVQGCSTSQDDCRDQIYKPSIPDKALVGHIIANKTVLSPQICRIQCYMDPNCVSTNFDQNERNFPNCQLSSSEADSHPQDMVNKPGVLYQGTKNNCQNGTCPSTLMECHSGFRPQGYRCRFPDKCCKVPNQRVLYFPRKSVDDYVKLETSFSNSLKALTFSLMVKIESSIEGIVTPFSLATKTQANHMLFEIKATFMLLHVSSRNIKINKVLDVGKWHHFLVTWESTSGKWQVYLDGHILEEGTNLATGLTVDNGMLILGQDQDSYGGGFDSHQSFGKGRLTSVSLWDRVLLPHDGSFSYLTNFECHPQLGNVLKWEDLLRDGELKGDIKLV